MAKRKDQLFAGLFFDKFNVGFNPLVLPWTKAVGIHHLFLFLRQGWTSWVLVATVDFFFSHLKLISKICACCTFDAPKRGRISDFTPAFFATRIKFQVFPFRLYSFFSSFYNGFVFLLWVLLSPFFYINPMKLYFFFIFLFFFNTLYTMVVRSSPFAFMSFAAFLPSKIGFKSLLNSLFPGYYFHLEKPKYSSSPNLFLPNSVVGYKRYSSLFSSKTTWPAKNSNCSSFKISSNVLIFLFLSALSALNNYYCITLNL